MYLNNLTINVAEQDEEIISCKTEHVRIITNIPLSSISVVEVRFTVSQNHALSVCMASSNAHIKSDLFMQMTGERLGILINVSANHCQCCSKNTEFH